MKILTVGGEFFSADRRTDG